MLQHCKKAIKARNLNDCLSCGNLTECREEYIKRNANGIDNIHTHDIGSAIKDAGNKFIELDGCLGSIFKVVVTMAIFWTVVYIIYSIGSFLGK